MSVFLGEDHFIVFSVPQPFQVILGARRYKLFGANVDFIDRTFSRFSYENNFKWIQALPVLTDRYLSKGNDCYFRLDGHLNNNGNSLVGRYLADELIRSGSLTVIK